MVILSSKFGQVTFVFNMQLNSGYDNKSDKVTSFMK